MHFTQAMRLRTIKVVSLDSDGVHLQPNSTSNMPAVQRANPAATATAALAQRSAYLSIVVVQVDERWHFARNTAQRNKAGNAACAHILLSNMLYSQHLHAVATHYLTVTSGPYSPGSTTSLKNLRTCAWHGQSARD